MRKTRNMHPCHAFVMLCFTRERGREGAKILKYVQMQYERTSMFTRAFARLDFIFTQVCIFATCLT
jgi:hypothetical protein